MKAIRNKDNTIDLIGLTAEQTYLLTAILGKTTDNYFVPEYQALSQIFPKAYFDQPSIPAILLHKMDTKAMKQSLIDAGFVKAPAKQVPLPLGHPRRADGRFKSKKWVARFNYESGHGYEKRTIVTEYRGKGKKPFYGTEDKRYIKGYDAIRKAFRQFSLENADSVVWSREYQD